MDYNHIKNAMAYINNKVETIRMKYGELADMAYTKGNEKAANSFLDRGFALTPYSICPQYDAFVKEIEKRDKYAREHPPIF